ncbi:hypothetical protein Q3G72_002921 [Acer saccharum]|nr:hypothetical protein Q3G72_002921 [Acer saccharum]
MSEKRSVESLLDNIMETVADNIPKQKSVSFFEEVCMWREFETISCGCSKLVGCGCDWELSYDLAFSGVKMGWAWGARHVLHGMVAWHSNKTVPAPARHEECAVLS